MVPTLKIFGVVARFLYSGGWQVMLMASGKNRRNEEWEMKYLAPLTVTADKLRPRFTKTIKNMAPGSRWCPGLPTRKQCEHNLQMLPRSSPRFGYVEFHSVFLYIEERLLFVSCLKGPEEGQRTWSWTRMLWRILPQPWQPQWWILYSNSIMWKFFWTCTGEIKNNIYWAP